MPFTEDQLRARDWHQKKLRLRGEHMRLLAEIAAGRGLSESDTVVALCEEERARLKKRRR
jgi:hypothetical protein